MKNVAYRSTQEFEMGIRALQRNLELYDAATFFYEVSGIQ